MLGFLFVFVTARPLSLRRLGLFFTLVFVLSTGTLEVLRASHAMSGALITATALTLLVWSLPLAQTLRESVRARTLALNGLSQVSAFVQWTYGFALAAGAVLLPLVIFSSVHHLTVGVLAQLLAVVGVLGLVVPLMSAAK